MTRDEMAAAISVALDASPDTPGRLDTIIAVVDHYTAAEVSGAYDRGYDQGHGDAEDEAAFHAETAARIAEATP